MKNKVLNKQLIAILIFMAFASIFFIYDSPLILDYGVRKMPSLTNNQFLQISLCSMCMCVSGGILYYNCIKNGKTLIKFFLTALIVGIISLLVSLLNGGLAVLIYHLFEKKGIDAVKSIIDVVAKVTLLAISPLIISFFWNVSVEKKVSIRSIIENMKIDIKKYLQVFCINTLTYCVGSLIQFALNLISFNGIKVIEVILFTLLGSNCFILLRKICLKEDAT